MSWPAQEGIYSMQQPHTASARGQDSEYSTWVKSVGKVKARYKAPPKANLWVIIGLTADNFSNELEWHKKIPMLVPTQGSGFLLGIAKSPEELRELLEEHKKYMCLVYKISISKRNGWRKMLEFFASQGMIERENDNL